MYYLRVLYVDAFKQPDHRLTLRTMKKTDGKYADYHLYVVIEIPKQYGSSTVCLFFKTQRK